ncbi:flagellar motor protein MotB, partial [bacterium]|nr:flagellar motor protein MotB [bacterium]
EEPGIPGWVVTYGDMMSLLLTFFILLLSFSSIQETKFKQAMESLQTALGVFKNSQSVIQFENMVVPQEVGGDQSEMLYEFRELEQYLLEENLDDQVEVAMTEDGIQIQIEDEFLFASGTADLQSGTDRILGKIAGFLDGKGTEIRVSGHTDSIPIRTARFPSNWELSASRAIAVARELQKTGIAPARMSATGYGEFRPIADNGTAEGRARNRRVEIFMRYDKTPEQGETTVLPFESEG